MGAGPVQQHAGVDQGVEHRGLDLRLSDFRATTVFGASHVFSSSGLGSEFWSRFQRHPPNWENPPGSPERIAFRKLWMGFEVEPWVDCRVSSFRLDEAGKTKHSGGSSKIGGGGGGQIRQMLLASRRQDFRLWPVCSPGKNPQKNNKSA